MFSKVIKIDFHFYLEIMAFFNYAEAGAMGRER